MPELVRVRDKDTGHTLSIPESAVPHGNYELVDGPAVDHVGIPLPPEHAKPTKTAVEPTTSGQQADTKKEKAHG